MKGIAPSSVARVAQWLLLSGWFGALGLFAIVVAPAAFRVLPSAEVAGQLVGPVLRSLNLYGVFAGVVISGLAAYLKAGRLAIVLPLVLAVTCGISEFVVTKSVAEVLPHTLGADSDPGAARRFAALHQASRLLFLVVLLGTGLLVAIHGSARRQG